MLAVSLTLPPSLSSAEAVQTKLCWASLMSWTTKVSVLHQPPFQRPFVGNAQTFIGICHRRRTDDGVIVVHRCQIEGGSTDNRSGVFYRYKSRRGGDLDRRNRGGRRTGNGIAHVGVAFQNRIRTTSNPISIHRPFVCWCDRTIIASEAVAEHVSSVPGALCTWYDGCGYIEDGCRIDNGDTR